MGAALVLFFKEIKDNLRDKRSLFFGLVYGPLLMPALMIGPIIFTVNKHAQYQDQGRSFHVFHAERAPNLVKYLRSKNLDAQELQGDFEQRIIDGDIKLVLEITQNYGEKLIAGEPAKVILHYNKEDTESQSLYWQLRGELDAYKQTLAAQRMSIRGFDQNLLRALDIADNDVSEEEFGAGTLGNILMFLIVFSTMMGGFHLAVDILAGERERLCLEPLLAMPISRIHIIIGKWLAILVFCTASCILPIISASIWIMFIPAPFFGNADIPGLMTFGKILLIALPICLLLSSLLVAIAAYSKSVKEAQTQLSIAMLLPMSPFFIVQFLNVKTSAITNFVPVLSHYLLVDKIVTDSTHSIAGILPSTLSIFILTAALLGFSIYQYRYERLLS